MTTRKNVRRSRVSPRARGRARDGHHARGRLEACAGSRGLGAVREAPVAVGDGTSTWGQTRMGQRARVTRLVVGSQKVAERGPRTTEVALAATTCDGEDDGHVGEATERGEQPSGGDQEGRRLTRMMRTARGGRRPWRWWRPERMGTGGSGGAAEACCRRGRRRSAGGMGAASRIRVRRPSGRVVRCVVRGRAAEAKTVRDRRETKRVLGAWAWASPRVGGWACRPGLV
jgi:hypothetical protein